MATSAADDERLARLLEQARGRPAAARAAFLLEACGDPQLREEAAEVLAWEERMGGFLLKPMLSFVDLARPFRLGEIVAGRFEIVREIGAGGMGVVYAAFDRTRRQKIAIKAAKPGFQSVLSPELEGALKVRHPNICLVNEIHSAHTAQGSIDFLTMELLEGETLAARLSQRGQLPRAEALDSARQICAGLAEAHRSNIIHRDLKAANIMLCPAPNGTTRVVITDFGLAGVAAPGLADLGGTPAYMAPELFDGGKTSKASDIYALGVILHEIFVGGQPNPRVRKSGDARWDRTIARCLDADPLARFDTATEIVHGLDQRWLSKERMLLAGLALMASFAVASQQAGIHEWLVDHFWPPSANVRLAVLPAAGRPEETSEVMSGVLQDVSSRVGKMRSERRTVIVFSPEEARDDEVRTIEQARSILHATHALQTTVEREGDEFVMHAAVIDLATQVIVGESTGRYSSVTLGNMPSALAGEVSLALRLQGGQPSESLQPAAALPYDRGLYLLRNEGTGYASAIPLFEQAARLDPASTLPLAATIEAQIARFEATKDAASMEDARRALRVAESINPDSVALRLAAGLLAESNGEYEQAREDYQRVRELDPRNVDAYLRTASVDDALNRPERAIDSYRKAIELEPGYYKPYHHFGVFYYYRSQYREAAEQFQKSIDRAPGRVDEYANLAAALSDLGDDARAEHALRASLEIRETPGAWNSLGAIRAYQNKDAEALADFRRAAALDASRYIYWLNLGDAARRLGDGAESADAYSRGVALAKSELAQNPRLGLTRAYAGYFTARLGDTQRAAEDIAEAMKFSPGDSKVMRRAVLTYEALGHRDDTFRVLRDSNPELLRELARHPDLVSLGEDVRFKELLSHLPPRGP